jgi:hypothetical protein
MRRVCRVLKFPRARLRARAVIAAAPPRLDEVLAERIQRLIELGVLPNLPEVMSRVPG